MRSHQMVILEKLSEYLTLHYKEIYGDAIPAELQEVITSLSEGHCFGFSLLHAVMDTMGRLNLWEHILERIETAEKITPDLLREKLSDHPDYQQIRASLAEALFEEAKISGKSEKGYTFNTDLVKEIAELDNRVMEKVLDRALNFVVYYHAINNIIFLPTKLSQSDVLKPGNKYFDFRNAKGETFVIQHRKIPVVGRLNADLIDQALDDAAFQKDPKLICLVHSVNHTIRVGVHSDKWFVYDPNFKRSIFSDFKYLRYYPSKKAAIDKIIEIQGRDLAIEMATTNPSPISAHTIEMPYEENELSVNLLLLLAEYKPGKLNDLIKTVTGQDNSPRTKILRSQFAKVLKESNQEQNIGSGLQVIINLLPHTIKLFMKHQDEDHAELQTSFIEALSIKDKNKGRTGLQDLIICCPKSLSKLIAAMEEDTVQSYLLQQGIADALVEIDTEGSTGLQAMIEDAPRVLEQLILTIHTLAEKKILSDLLAKKFASALRVEFKNKETAFHQIAKHYPHVMSSLVKLMSLNDQLMNTFARVLLYKNSEKETGLQMLIKHSPKAFIELIEFIIIKNWLSLSSSEDSKEESNSAFEKLKENLAAALLMKNKEGLTTLQMIHDSLPEAKQQMEELLAILNINLSAQSNLVKHSFLNQAQASQNDEIIAEVKDLKVSNG